MPWWQRWEERLGRGFDLLLDWLFRKRSIGLALVRSGTALAAVSVGGFAWRVKWGDAEFSFGGDAFLTLSLVGVGLGALLMAMGLRLVMRDHQAEARARERKRVLVVEQRGLQKRFSTPLKDAIPKALVGQIVERIIDVSPYFRDGALAEPAVAFMHVRDTRAVLRQGLGEVPPSDVTVVYGGVSPVPLTFLAGTFVEDESSVLIMDWDRIAGRWRQLDGEDDGDRFGEPDLAAIPAQTGEISVVVSVSHEVDEAAVRRLDPSRPLIALRLGKVAVGNHWSEVKQRALAEAFVRLLGALANRGVSEVHLFLAAPNSIVFRLGSHLDRNMPAVTVYQREPSDPIGFPWGIRMPAHGSSEPSYCPTPLGSAASVEP